MKRNLRRKMYEKVMKNSHEEKIMKKTINYFFMLPCIKQGEKFLQKNRDNEKTKIFKKHSEKTS